MRTLESTILIIEDHEAVRILMRLMLKEKFNVVTKSDGLEGMAWLSAGNMPDLIVTDMQMPRMNGLDFLTQLKLSGLFRHIPVLFVTCSDIEEYNTVLKKLGSAGIISKPFNPRVLKEKIEKILNNRGHNIAES